MGNTAPRHGSTPASLLGRARLNMARGGRAAVAWAMTGVLALSMFLGALSPVAARAEVLVNQVEKESTDSPIEYSGDAQTPNTVVVNVNILTDALVEISTKPVPFMILVVIMWETKSKRR